MADDPCPATNQQAWKDRGGAASRKAQHSPQRAEWLWKHQSPNENSTPTPRTHFQDLVPAPMPPGMVGAQAALGPGPVWSNTVGRPRKELPRKGNRPPDRPVSSDGNPRHGPRTLVHACDRGKQTRQGKHPEHANLSPRRNQDNVPDHHPRSSGNFRSSVRPLHRPHTLYGADGTVGVTTGASPTQTKEYAEYAAMPTNRTSIRSGTYRSTRVSWRYGARPSGGRSSSHSSLYPA